MNLVEFEGTEGGVYWVDPESVALVRHAVRDATPPKELSLGLILFNQVPDENNSVILVRGWSEPSKVKGSVSEVMAKLSGREVT